jgi:aspartyl-tRNA(Asn)/glutamyl-tRNA(Gln) amidotransferase subunit B
VQDLSAVVVELQITEESMFVTAPPWARGLAVVSDDGALGAAVDEAIAAQPAVADKIRGGNQAAAGALIGAVMKATGGKADAKRVRELILEKLA